MTTLESVRASVRAASEPQFDLPYKARGYGHQFSSVYSDRLARLAPRVVRRVQWSAPRVAKVLDINGSGQCWAVGTVFCDYRHKPNVLADVAREYHDPLPPPTTYRTQDAAGDRILLEDESGRVALVHDTDNHFFKHDILVTGCVVAVLGRETEPGVFKVDDLVYATPESQPERPASTPTVAFALGLGFSSSQLSSVACELLAEYLRGELGGETDRTSAAAVARLVVLGNLVASLEPSPLTEANGFLSSVLESLPVTLLPGTLDPVDLCFPQQPWHPALVPAAAPYDSPHAQLATNPALLDIGGLLVLALSGENVTDVWKYITPSDNLASDVDTRLDIMEAQLKWGHVAPTCPDTLWCYPFDNKDPFVLDLLPHVYVAGNQPAGGSRQVTIGEKHVLLVCVPAFGDSGRFAVVNSHSLEVSIA